MPCLRIEMDYLDNRRRPVMAATCIYRGDLYQLHVVLTPNAFTARDAEDVMSVTVGIDGGQSQIRMRVSGEASVSVAPGVSHLEQNADAAVLAAIARLWDERPDRPARLVAGLTTVSDAHRGATPSRPPDRRRDRCP